MVKITFPDGSVREYEQGVTGLQIAESISPALARNVVSCGVNGETVELNRPINEDANVELYKFEDEQGKHTFWHTSAHLLAEALQELYPGIQFGFGPAVESGFFYDVMPAEGQVISENDFAKIEAKMMELAKKNEPVVRKEVSKADALAEFKAAGFNIIIDFEAYSTRGSGHPLRFSNTQFDLASLEAYDGKEIVEIRKDVIKTIKQWGVDIQYKKSTRERFVVTYYTDESHNAASLALGAPGGLPLDMATAQSLKGSEEVVIAGFSGNTNIQSLSSFIKYFTSRTSRVANRFITLQDASNNWGFTGSPAFYKGSDGSYRVVGVNVGNFGGEVRVVPIHRVR